jgi:hypothetical protein
MKKFAPILSILLVLAVVMTASAQVTYPEGAYTSYSVVNLSSTDNANIYVTYYDPSGVAATYSPSFTNVAPGGSVTVQEAVETDLLPGRYSAVISSNTPIAAIANQQLGHSGDSKSIPPFSSYSGVSTGDTNVMLPSIMYNWFGYYTEIYIQNVGDGPATNITVTYNPTTLDTCTTGASGQSDAAATVAKPLAQYATVMVSQSSKTSLGAAAASGCSAYTGRFLGSAKVTADKPVVVIVNQYVQNKLFTYNGYTATSGTGVKLIAPGYMRNYYGYYASLTISNPNASDAQIKLTYMSDGNYSNPKNTQVIATHTVPAGKSINIYDGPPYSAVTDLTAKFPADSSHKFFGTVLIESTNAVPVQALINQESIMKSGNKAGSYNAMAATEGTKKISIPLVQSGFWGYFTSITVMTVDGTEASLKITYTSDSVLSSAKGVSKSYTMSTVNGFLNRYEAPTALAGQYDILNDPTFLSGGQHKFIGSAVIEVLSGPAIVAYVNSESVPISGYSGVGRDTMYTFNAFNLTP